MENHVSRPASRRPSRGRKNSQERPNAETKLIRMAFVGFGLLFLLQAILNVSLRLSNQQTTSGVVRMLEDQLNATLVDKEQLEANVTALLVEVEKMKEKEVLGRTTDENCRKQKKGHINNGDRTDYICEPQIDYAYKVRVEWFGQCSLTDIYMMRVEEVIKEGSADVQPQNKLRSFLSYRHCRDTLITQGRTYLVMGTSQDILRNEEPGTFQYILGERTWIEYWPSPTECQEADLMSTCEGIEALRHQYELFGCPV